MDLYRSRHIIIAFWIILADIRFCSLVLYCCTAVVSISSVVSAFGSEGELFNDYIMYVTVPQFLSHSFPLAMLFISYVCFKYVESLYFEGQALQNLRIFSQQSLLIPPMSLWVSSDTQQAITLHIS